MGGSTRRHGESRSRRDGGSTGGITSSGRRKGGGAVLGYETAFINDLEEGIDQTLSKLATKLEGVTYTLEGCAAIHQDLDRAES